MKYKKSLSAILTCIIILFSIVFCSANSTHEPTVSATTKIILNGVEEEDATITLYIQNEATSEIIAIDFIKETKWTTTVEIPHGKYNIIDIETVDGKYDIDINASYGSAFITNPMLNNDVSVYVRQTLKAPSLTDVLKDNILLIGLLLGCGIGLYIVKAKRDKGEA